LSGMMSFKYSSVGIKEQDNIELSVYPNPTTKLLIIESSKLIIRNVEIFDICNRKLNLKMKQFSPQECQFDISHLSIGIYFVKITTEIGKVIKKVLKE